MKATLSFSLPEDQSEFNLAQRAGTYLTCLEDFANYLRGKVKHGCDSEAESKVYHEVHDEFWRILGEYKLDPFGEWGP